MLSQLIYTYIVDFTLESAGHKNTNMGDRRWLNTQEKWHLGKQQQYKVQIYSKYNTFWIMCKNLSKSNSVLKQNKYKTNRIKTACCSLAIVTFWPEIHQPH